MAATTDGKVYSSSPDFSQGTPVDVTQVTTGAGVVERQRVGLGDPAGLTPDIRPTPAGSMPTDTSADMLIVHQMQQQTKLLRAILFVLSHMHVPALHVSDDGLSVFEDVTTPTL